MPSERPTAREFAARECDGVRVLLLWHPREDAVSGFVEDARAGHCFELEVECDQALMPSTTLALARVSGESYVDIATVAGVSDERVRQVLQEEAAHDTELAALWPTSRLRSA
jgi:hypothetical protein